ncbi:lysophospholipid acyltransferase family protein [Desulfohalovibrio reitneri]|uniref:lysophospholipid acyltransferase family protein n=1 Tax=Desulfohalovibrio reitneri TaxID=1307759 RepID=UPI0009DDB3A4|nr:lysophospholipid acyltransferase family protein [Desulfohalovibrio reitneri]
MKDLAYELLAFAGRRQSLERLHSLGDVLGRVMWFGLPTRRKLATRSATLHLSLPKQEAEKVARASFGHAARSFCEIMAAGTADWRFLSERVRVAEPELLRLAKTTDRPVLFATGHLGAWELQSSIFNHFQGKEHNVVVRRSKDQAMNMAMHRLRSRPGLSVLPHRNAVRPVLRSFRKGGMCAMLVDHNCTRDEALFLPFLGMSAAVNFGPALLAVRGDALVMPSALVREGDGYVQRFLEPLDTRELQGDRQERISQTASFYTRAVESLVRQYPRQWFWMHRRWKTRPPEEGQKG